MGRIEIPTFDAQYFGIPETQVNRLSILQKTLLQVSVHALENAVVDYLAFGNDIGLFFSVDLIAPSKEQKLSQRKGTVNKFNEMLQQSPEMTVSRVAYHLNLRGPTMAIQAACASSGVAIHTASRSLLAGDCHIAMSGGISLMSGDLRSLVWEEGSILSKDGCNQSYDVSASGTVPSEGVGMVVLMRLEDAISSGLPVRAVLCGSSITNDGSLKASYTSSNVLAQELCARKALVHAGISHLDVGFVEGHSSATLHGDACEIQALLKVYEERPIGACKANIGHTGAASTVASVIKTILALEVKEIPPQIHWKRWNPVVGEMKQLSLSIPTKDNSSSSSSSQWREEKRYVAVNSFGQGGTNVHIILSSPPIRKSEPRLDNRFILPISAPTQSAAHSLVNNCKELVSKKNQSVETLNQIAATLQMGQAFFPYRTALLMEYLPLVKYTEIPLQKAPENGPMVIFSFLDKETFQSSGTLNFMSQSQYLGKNLTISLRVWKMMSSVPISKTVSS